MAVLTVVKQWVDKIWRVELDTRWAGGEDGTANIQAKQLAARTEFLKDFADEVEAAREGEGSLLERINKSGVEPVEILAKFGYINDTPVAASTENVDVVSGGLMEMDGIELKVSDLVFLKDQDEKKQNGFWQVQTGAWNRFPGYQAADKDCFTYKYIFIKTGETNQGKVFFLDKDVYTIDTTDLVFKVSIFSSFPIPGKILLRDESGAAEDFNKQFNLITSHGDSREGRNLFDVLKIGSVAELGPKLEERADGASNNPNFSGLMIGDYVDGIDLVSGSLNVPWDDTYKNNRIVLSGFNQYKGCGRTENKKNHFLFTFKDIPLEKHMNATDTNSGGYASTEMTTFLESDFKNALIAALGDFLYPVQRLISISDSDWGWETDSVFLPTEYEVFGAPVWSYVGYGGGFQCQFPIFQRSCEYLVKKLNGTRTTWWTASKRAGSSTHFVLVNYNGHLSNTNASSALGCAPAFCVTSRYE